MSSLILFLSVLIIGFQTWAAPVIYDGKTCEIRLSPALLQKLISESSSRQTLAGGVATYLPGDQKAMKLLDVKGEDPRKVSEAIIQKLRFREDKEVNPYLQAVIEKSFELACKLGAVFSISSWVMPDGARTIRLSLDMAEDPNAHITMLRLPNLDIRNGSLAKRIDIDLTPARLTLLTGTAQALSGEGKMVVSEPASHSLGLEISEATPNHPVIDAFMASVDYFIGSNAKPNLSALLDVAESIARDIFPHAQALTFKTQEEAKAVNHGHGWQVIH
jgi:hypothetical protein